MHDPVLYLAGLIHKHLSTVCFSITAVLLMLAHPSINNFISRATQRFHWLVRYLLFVVVCTAGYGAIMQIIYRSLKHWFSYQRNLALIVIVAVIYLALAFFAKKQGHI